MKKLLIILSFVTALITNAQTVSITSSASGAICSGTNVIFTANTSGFSNPYYQWYANGTAITGATSSTYSSSSLTNGVQVNVKINEGPFGGDVTSNGLLLNLDAAVQSSYSGSGLTWNNIAPLGNSVVTDFQLTSTNASYSSDYGGVIRFSSAGGWASSSTGFPNLSSYSVEVWVRPGGTRGDYDPSIAANTNYTPCFFSEKVYNEGAGNRVNMVLAYNARGLTAGTANNSYRYEAAINNGSWKKHQIATDYSTDLNNWVQIVSVYNGSTLTIYRNGVSLGTSSALGISSLRQSTIGYYIAHRWDMTDGVYGDYSKVMMYNKALSASEVTTNYSAFSARFVDNSVSSTSITTTVNASPSVPSITGLGDGCVNKTSLSTPSGQTAYAWYKDDVVISGATSNIFTPTSSGSYKVQVTSGSCSTTSTATAIFSCGNDAFGKMVALTNASSIISLEGGANLGTGKDITGKIYNTTSLTTTSGTIGSTTAVLGGVISATNAVTSSIGIIYSTDANFGTYSTTTIQSNVTAGTYTSTISGLSYSTNYHAKSFIVNKAGTSYGSVVSFTTTAPTALDAIVLNLDATNNSSYGGSGSIWNDVSGQNNTATFTSTPTFSSNPGSLTFSTASYATTISSTINLTTATFIAWVNPSQIQSNYTGIIYLPKSSTDLNNRYGMQFRTNNSVGYTWGMNGATTYNWDSQLYTPNNQWSMVAISVSANSTTAYLCNASGITSAINTDTHAAASGFKYYVGRDPISYSSSEADLRTFKGKISRVSVYNATLTQADITNIFNAQKSTFGIN